MKNSIVIIGFGKQGQEYFESIEKLSNISIKAIVDSSFNQNIYLEKASIKVGEDIILLENIKDLEEYDNCTAIICVPHKYHFEITKNCIKKGFNIIKEKPLDYSYLNAKKLEEISIQYNKKIFTLCQRIYDPIFSEFIKKINLIGKPYALQYDYFLSHNKTTGWRSKKDLARGGVLLDMGYHIIDTINNFFGEIIETNSYSAFSNEETKKEILEDYTTISFKNRREVIGTINIGRNYNKKKEYITVFCDQGVAEISPKKGFSIYNNNGQEIYKVEVHVKKEEVTRNQIQDFLNIINFNDEFSYKKHFNRHLLNVETIDHIYSKQQINFLNSI